MRRGMVSLAILAAMPVAAASAADMPLKAPPVPPVPYVGYNWTGFYIGGEFGVGWASEQSTVLTQTSPTSAFPPGFVASPVNLSGILGGFYGGYNYQINQFLVGIDADYTWADLTGTQSDLSPIPGNGAVSHHNDQMNWVSTVTGRLGYLNNNWLFFAKGGGAWGGFYGSSNTYSGAGALSNTSFGSTNRDGWTAGGGLEWGFAAHWSAKLEYDYVNFDTITHTLTETNAATGAVGYPARSTTSYLNMVKGGVAYRF